MALVEGRYFTGSMTDKRFEADGLAEYCRRFLSSGVWELGDNLQVTPSEGLSVNVGYGSALVEGYPFQVKDNGTGLLNLQLDEADALPRIDRVVVRKDPVALRVHPYIKKGLPAASPQAPVLEKANGVFEVSLARILVVAGAVQISAGNITDERANDHVRMGSIFFHPGGAGIGIGSAADADEFQVYWPAQFKSVLKVNSNNVWHQGNDGPGSGLDADTLDGLHASAFHTTSAMQFETGSWTPTFYGASSAGTPTYNYRAGRYMRIGNYIHLSGYVGITNKGGMAGAVRIGNIPFACGGANSAGSIGAYQGVISTLGIHIDAGTSHLAIQKKAQNDWLNTNDVGNDFAVWGFQTTYSLI